MKSLSTIGSTRKRQQRERTRTLRKSRRLALKRSRKQQERRTSVADMLQLTPTRRHGNDLVQESAEQLALNGDYSFPSNESEPFIPAPSNKIMDTTNPLQVMGTSQKPCESGAKEK